MELNQMQHYKNKETGDVICLFAVARKCRNGDLQAVYQNASQDGEFWVESIDNFKEKFEHVPVNHRQCKAPGCKTDRQGFYPYCKDHG